MFGDLTATANGESVSGDVFGDAGAGTDVGSVAEADGSDKRGVTADEDAVADAGAVLGCAVVVAGDGAGADVGGFADLGITDVGEMVGLRAFADAGFFHFDEVADVSLFADFAAGAEMDERADFSAIGDRGVFEYAGLADEDVVADSAVFNDGEGADAAAGADVGFAEELDEGLNDGFRSDFDIGIDDAGFGASDGDAGGDEARGGMVWRDLEI